MADEFDGTSPWGDHPSLSENNSSVNIHKESTTIDDHDVDNVVDSNEASSPISGTSITSPRKSKPSIRQSRSRKIVTQSISVDEDANPLGPLGEVEQPEPELLPLTTSKKDDASSLQDVPLKPDTKPMIDSKFNNLTLSPTKDSEPLPPTPRQSDEHFTITVGDPIKVGDLTSAHTVYTVTTKTNSPLFTKPESSVTRRYRDFRWIFHALENNNPGIIVPPPPEKQAVGRFNEDFVEARRSALENMLNKIVSHPVLRHDPDFKLFLESDSFGSDIKSRSSNVSEDMMESTINPSVIGSSSGGGIMSTLGGAFSFSAKYVETNEWFVDKKAYLDSLESQLKSLLKALDLVVTQRKELSDTTGEFSNVLNTLSSVEISRNLSNLLTDFSNAQSRIKDLYSRQCLQDVLSLSTTLEEYIRLISSIRSVFNQRQRIYLNAQNAEHELTKKRQNLEKLQRQGKTLQDKITNLQVLVENQEKVVLNLRVSFDDITKQIISEFDRFEHEKIRDFRNSVELFLENAVESQKEAIEIWETFYQLAGFA